MAAGLQAHRRLQRRRAGGRRAATRSPASKGRRWSTAEAYLGRRWPGPTSPCAPAPSPPGRCSRATAPSASTTGAAARSTTGVADAEVVLAGGAINSPQLLMLSGIGPADHLRELGIDVAVDLPGVGENLHDHPVVPSSGTPRDTTDLARPSTPCRTSLALARPRGTRAADLQRRRGRRVLHEPRRPGRARPADPRAPDRLLRQRAARADHAARSRSAPTLVTSPAAAAAAALGRPTWHPDGPGVLRRPGRPRRDGGRRADGASRSRSQGRWPATSTRPSCPTRTTRPTPSRRAHPRAGPRPSTTRSAPARWAPASTPWSTPSCGCAGSRACGWPTPR